MTREQYESLSAAQLKSIAKTRGLKVSSGMRKSEVVNLMLEEDEKTAQTEKTVQKDETSEKQADKVAENSTYQEGTAEKKEKEDNNILLESAGENMDLKDQKWVDQINGNSGNLWLNLDGKAYSLVYQTSSETGLTVVGMIPTSFLQKTARELEKTTVMLIGISILLCILLANIMARGITRPIEKTKYKSIRKS